MSQIQSIDNSNEKITTQKPTNDESTSQYQIRPSIGKSFPITAIREIINEVLLQILDGTWISTKKKPIYFNIISNFCFIR